MHIEGSAECTASRGCSINVVDDDDNDEGGDSCYLQRSCYDLTSKPRPPSARLLLTQRSILLFQREGTG